MPDGAATIHTAVAAVLTGARLGVEAGLECPDPETGDALETACTEEHTPDNLSGALAALEADSAFADAIGRPMVDQFSAIKAVEWEKYVATVGDPASVRDRVTDWEKATYLPYI